jgi:ubiquinone/menaquinone biosynthesis C-methylase UbiE
MASEAGIRSAIPLKLIEGSAESIPLDDRSIDTVVTTWTMCSVPGIDQALAEIRRVLKPGGRLLFVEHGRAPEARVRWWQDHLNPVWKRVSGGCHLNRAIATLVADAGFDVERLENSYMPGPKPMTYMYEGSARPG